MRQDRSSNPVSTVHHVNMNESKKMHAQEIDLPRRGSLKSVRELWVMVEQSAADPLAVCMRENTHDNDKLDNIEEVRTLTIERPVF